MTSSNPSPKQWVVGHINWFDNELTLERITAATWQEAAFLHSKYPFLEEDGKTKTPVDHLPDVRTEEDFRVACFYCDCMMNWIEVT